MAFDQQHLTDLGFAGFVPLRALPPKCATVPDLPGIYASRSRRDRPTS